MVRVDALTQVIKEERAVQSSSIQMLSDLTLAISKVLALFNKWICMGEKKKTNRTEFGRNCSYFLFLLSLQAK